MKALVGGFRELIDEWPKVRNLEREVIDGGTGAVFVICVLFFPAGIWETILKRINK